MQGLYPSRQTLSEFSPATLYAEIEQWVTAVVKNVAPIVLAVGEHDVTDAKSLFAEHWEGLTELALLLIDYTERQRHPYYSVFHRSAETLAAAEATITRARQCAKLFTGYYYEPQTYNKDDAAVDLHFLLTELTGLWGWLARAVGERTKHNPSARLAAADKQEALPQQYLPGATEKSTFPTPGIPLHELIELLCREYSKDGLLELAFTLNIKGIYLEEATPRTLASSLVRQAWQDSKYLALLEEVRRERPDLLS